MGPASVLFALALTGCGGGGDEAVSHPGPASAELRLLAGNPGGSGNADGVGALAAFHAPAGAAVDGSGNLYVADSGSHLIRKVTPAGAVTTLAGKAGTFGSTDGNGTSATFAFPMGVAADSSGNVYVADTFNGTIRKITPAGMTSTLAGTAGVVGSADGTGASASFYQPFGLAVDKAGNIIVADTVNRTLRKITPAGVVSTLAGTAGVFGSADGPGALATFAVPIGVAVDSNGTIYVADSGNKTIRKVTPEGVVSTLAGQAGVEGSADGPGPLATFGRPYGVAVDDAGNLYVSDQQGNNTIQNTIRKITPGGVVSTLAGATGIGGSADGPGKSATFNRPSGVAVDSSGNVYVADQDNNTIRKITSSAMVSTLAGMVSVSGSADGVGTAATFNGPVGLAVDLAGNTYVADRGNSIVRKVTANGVVSTLAGMPNKKGSADGVGGTAAFDVPTSVAVDDAGNVYVADGNIWEPFTSQPGGYTVRKITPEGVVSTLAGTAGQPGSVDGTGTAARFFDPRSVAVDHSGNVYVSDHGTIRKINPAGVVSTLAGQPGVLGKADGIGTSATFNLIGGLAVDSAGNVYVADTDTLRKITPEGIVSTLVGQTGGTGMPANLALDGAGNFYVAGLYTISKITPAGVVSTFVGTAATIGFSPGQLPGVVSGPGGVAAGGNTLCFTTSNAVAEVINIP